MTGCSAGRNATKYGNEGNDFMFGGDGDDHATMYGGADDVNTGGVVMTRCTATKVTTYMVAR